LCDAFASARWALSVGIDLFCLNEDRRTAQNDRYHPSSVPTITWIKMGSFRGCSPHDPAF
jgi:hypothetical protein